MRLDLPRSILTAFVLIGRPADFTDIEEIGVSAGVLTRLLAARFLFAITIPLRVIKKMLAVANFAKTSRIMDAVRFGMISMPMPAPANHIVFRPLPIAALKSPDEKHKVARALNYIPYGIGLCPRFKLRIHRLRFPAQENDKPRRLL